MCRVGMGCLCWNFHMLCDKISIYPGFAVHLCQDSHLNVHWNKKCSVFHICLFSERYDFCDFDIGCSSVSTNFVKHRTRFYWIIKRNRNIRVLTRGCRSCNFQPCFRGGSVIFVPKGVGGSCVFYQPHFQMLRPTPPPPPIHFDPSLISRYVSCFLIMRNKVWVQIFQRFFFI